MGRDGLRLARQAIARARRRARALKPLAPRPPYCRDDSLRLLGRPHAAIAFARSPFGLRERGNARTASRGPSVLGMRAIGSAFGGRQLGVTIRHNGAEAEPASLLVPRPPHRLIQSLRRLGRPHAATRVCALPLGASRRGAPARRSRRYTKSGAMTTRSTTDDAPVLSRFESHQTAPLRTDHHASSPESRNDAIAPSVGW